jgi:hypothetical protein
MGGDIGSPVVVIQCKLSVVESYKPEVGISQ